MQTEFTNIEIFQIFFFYIHLIELLILSVNGHYSKTSEFFLFMIIIEALHTYMHIISV